MPDLTVSSSVDSFMQAANTAAMRNVLEIGDGSSPLLDRTFAHPARWDYFWSASNTVSTVSGSGSTNANDFAGNVQTGATSSSRAQLAFPSSIGSTFLMSGVNAGFCDFSKRFTAGFAISWVSSSTNGKIFVRIGENSSTSGDLSDRGFGICIANTSLVGQTHNGTTKTDSASLATMSSNNTTYVIIQSDGAGNVAFYINGSLATTLTNGPTANGVNAFGIAVEALNGSDSSSSRLQISPIQIIRAP